LCSPFDYQAKEKRLFRQAQKSSFFQPYLPVHCTAGFSTARIAPVAGHHRAVPSATLDKGFSIVGVYYNISKAGCQDIFLYRNQEILYHSYEPFSLHLRLYRRNRFDLFRKEEMP